MAKRRGPGRPERFPTEKETRGLCDIIAIAGTNDHEAYTLADVPRTTFYQWVDKGRASRAAGRKDKYSLFLNRIDNARASRTVDLLKRIATAAKDPKNWQAAHAQLRMSDQKRFGERFRVHVEEELTDAIKRIKGAFSADPAGLERALSAIAGEDGGDGVEPAPGPESGPDG